MPSSTESSASSVKPQPKNSNPSAETSGSSSGKFSKSDNVSGLSALPNVLNVTLNLGVSTTSSTVSTTSSTVSCSSGDSITFSNLAGAFSSV